TYAEAILSVCRYYVESPSIAAAGVTGANLKRRIETIVANERARPLGRGTVAIVAMLIATAILGPVALGAMVARRPNIAQIPATRPSGPLEFQAASIKPHRSPDGSRSAGFQPGGRFVARNMPLRNLVAIAYGEPAPLPLLRVVGGPDWLDTERFDIEASAGAPEASVAPGFSTPGERMLQSLLAERFKLAAHEEKRELPVFTLVPLRRDGSLAPGVTVSNSTDCAGGIVTATCGFGFVPEPNAHARHYRARSVTMEGLAKNLGSYLGLGIDRLVVDQTGLSGAYSFDLEFASPAAGGGPPDNGISIFTALQEQAGLKLESARAPVDVVVIDHAERLQDDGAQVAPPPAPLRASVPSRPPARAVVSVRQPTGTITGTVTDSFSNEPLAGVVVEVATEDPPNNPRTVKTDTDGNFAVEGLLPDVYIVTLHAHEYQTFKREGLRVGADETARVVAALRYGGPIRD
ncbi:MAG TPA: TIGR03435 family protein, partial [Vicinamibacterales bacterium]|nr:TIGR03435 family protein [Vicinamibacterales bacterium]